MATLSRKLRNQAGEKLNKAGADGNARFHNVGSALAAFFAALGSCGIEAADVVSGDMLLGDRGHRTVSLAESNPQDPFSPIPLKQVLAFSWTQLQSGFEVIAYLT